MDQKAWCNVRRVIQKDGYTAFYSFFQIGVLVFQPIAFDLL